MGRIREKYGKTIAWSILIVCWFGLDWFGPRWMGWIDKKLQDKKSLIHYSDLEQD